MPFFKLDETGGVISAPSVFGPGFELQEADHADHAYPVDGWVWATDLQTAVRLLGSAPINGVPQSVSMRQARLALLSAGVLGNVSAAIAAMPTAHRKVAEIMWEYSVDVHRTDPLVSQLGPALGLDDAALDALFVTAASL